MKEDFSAEKSGFQEMIDRYSRELLRFRSMNEGVSSEGLQPENLQPEDLRSGIESDISDNITDAPFRGAFSAGASSAGASSDDLPPENEPFDDSAAFYPESVFERNIGEGFGAGRSEPPWAKQLRILETDLEELKRTARELEKKCAGCCTENGGGHDEDENTSGDENEDIPVGTATLRVVVFTADRALPIAGADVVITRAEGGRDLLCAAGITDESGRTAAFSLEAVEMDGSDQLTEPGAYSEYTVYVTADGFEPVKREAQLVATVASTLPVTMTPLVSVDNGR